MVLSIADALEILNDVESALRSDQNEAQTRFHIIDRVLFELLGWNRHDPSEVTVEERTPLSEQQYGWIDYTLSGRNRASLIVEAKRSSTKFIDFELTALDRYRRLNQLSKTARKAVDQARDYALSKGASLVVATNGTEWLIVRPHIDTVPADELPIICFASLSSVKENIAEFSELLSPKAFRSARFVPIFERLASNRASYAESYLGTHRYPDRGQPDHALAAPVRYLMRQLFDRIDTPDKREMLEKCYVDESRTRQYSSTLESALKEHVPGYIKDDTEILDPTSTDPLTEALAESTTKGELVLIVGNVGVGKTTFIKRFLEIVLQGRLRQRLVVGTVDFNEIVQSSGLRFDADRLRQEVSRRALDDLNRRASERKQVVIDPYHADCLRGIYSAQIVRAKSAFIAAHRREPGPDELHELILDSIKKGQEDPWETLRGFALHLRGTVDAPLCVALDNVDHRSADLEKFVYRYAVDLTREPNCVCLVSMREDTYYRSRRDFLDTRNDPVFFIRPPALQQVMKKRIDYAKTSLLQDPKRRKNIERRVQPVTINQVVDVIDIMQEMFLGKSRDVRELIEVFSQRSVRESFRLISEFSTSGHLDLGRMIVEYNKTVFKQGRRFRGNPTFFSSVLKALMLGKNSSYRPSQSPVPNIYSSSTVVRETRLTRLWLLQRAAAAALEPGSGSGFRGEWLTAEVYGCGISREHTEQAFAQLVAWNLFRPRLAPQSAQLVPDDLYEVTALGHYFLETLAFEYSYLLFVADDIVFYTREHMDEYLRERSRGMSNQVSAIVSILQADENSMFLAAPQLQAASWRWSLAERLDSGLRRGPH